MQTHTHARATADMDMLKKSSCTCAENCVLVAPQGNNRVANRQLIATLSNKPCLLVLDSLNQDVWIQIIKYRLNKWSKWIYDELLLPPAIHTALAKIINFLNLHGCMISGECQWHVSESASQVEHWQWARNLGSMNSITHHPGAPQAWAK